MCVHGCGQTSAASDHRRTTELWQDCRLAEYVSYTTVGMAVSVNLSFLFLSHDISLTLLLWTVTVSTLVSALATQIFH